MKEHVKPACVVINDVSEGVFAASGDGDSTCFTATARIEYKPGDPYAAGHYSIRLMAHHSADHFSAKQRFRISFNLPVRFIEQQGGGVLHSGDGSTTLEIDFDSTRYAVGKNDSPGFGYLKVDADPGLAILTAECIDILKTDKQH